MINTLVVSAFSCSGKTYLTNSQDGGKYSYLDLTPHIEGDNWEVHFVDIITENLGSVDFIFIPINESILKELKSRGIPFIVVAPDNAEFSCEDIRLETKEDWFRRFEEKDDIVLMDLMKDKYDELTSLTRLMDLDSNGIILLCSDQYLSTVLDALERKRLDLYK